MLPVIGELRPWSDPTQIEMHRLPMHVPLGGFERRNLDGRWSLEMFEHPDRIPTTALTGERPKAVTADVPGNWTLHDLDGFVDLPHYTNVRMPFPGPPPNLPERNPAGVYRRSFNVPAAWLRRRTVLHVAGAESVHAVYLNGGFVGYGTDSRLPSEYDLRPHLVRGGNELAIVVVRYSAHSYIEDQDQWWMAGLHRSVWVESRPAVHLGDARIDVECDASADTATVTATAVVDFDGAPASGWTLRATLDDPTGERVGAIVESDVPHRHAGPYTFTGFECAARWDVAHPRRWSAEQPERYTVTLELLDRRGAVRHTERQRIGIRSVEVGDRQLLVNGRPVWVFGVNRHDHHPDRGKAVTVDDMRADLEVMRAHNITAIRTSHYPNDEAFYELCDELGFYLIDESNIESHGYNWSVCDDPRYRSAWLERGARMVQRDRNHPSIILWSLGNESGYGDNHAALAGWIRRTDPSRPLHYEDAIRIEGWADGGRPATDVVCPMYPEIDAIRDYGESDADRPLIMCEYSHAMGNSNGSLADYWDVITATPGLQGGFLWEWKDHGLRQQLADGTTRLAYGGQFGETPHDGNFVADGLVSADLEPHPAMREVAWVYRPVVVTRTRNGLEVENRRSFTDLGDLSATWELIVDGESVSSGELDVPEVGPHASTRLELPVEAPAGAESWWTVRWTTRHDTWFARAGHLVAWDQLDVSRGRRRRPSRSVPRPDAVPAGVAPELNLWRAPTDNDGFKLMTDLGRRIGVGGAALVRWEDIGVDRRPAAELVGHEWSARDDDHATTFRHTVDVPAELADLPRVGVTFALPERFDRVRWFGRGPDENYPDRNRSALLGVWESTPDESPYLVPQAHGLRTDCRWIELIDSASGETIRVDIVEPTSMHCSVVRHHDHELYEAATHTDLPASTETVVHLDVAHRGLGTASCGPDVLPRYRLGAGRYEFSYRTSRLG